MSNSEWLEQLAVALAAEHHFCALPKSGRKQTPEIEEKGCQLERFRVECAELRARRHRAGPLSVSNERVEPVIAVYKSSAGGTHHGQAIVPTIEWLIDNLPVVEKHLREIGEDLRNSNYDDLPKLTDGDLAGFPRIYAIAASLTAHVNYSLDADTLKRFMLAYQDTAPLTVCELGRLCIMLRLALLENLQRHATCIITLQGESDESIGFANRLSGISEARPEYITGLRAKMENTLASMRLLSMFNWPVFLESISPVDLVFGEDPAGVYPSMEFATRDRYRQVVERIAQYTNVTERDVARCVVELALDARSSHPDDEYMAHVGYYLIDRGRAELERSVVYQPFWRERFSRAVRRKPTAFCMGLLSLLTMFILALFVLYASLAGASALMLAWLLVLLLIPASEVALRTVDAILILEPSLLPKMDFTSGIPEELQTMVVIPAIFSSKATIHELLKSIEAHYLVNQDDHIFFALLGDWSDAPQEEMPYDSALLEIAVSGIKELNIRHRHGSRDRFYLFHRRRLWNRSEGKWMGWERKRGKLCEFNWLLRGRQDTSYIVRTADQAFLAHIRYVITVDSDTHLPRDVARRLIGTISHPLNRPRIDAQSGRVVRGYVIIQPAVNCLPHVPSGPVSPEFYQTIFMFDRARRASQAPIRTCLVKASTSAKVSMMSMLLNLC